VRRSRSKRRSSDGVRAVNQDWTRTDVFVVSVCIAFGILFIVSIFQLTAIQTRVLAEHGWLAFAKRKVKGRDVYWYGLSVGQRLRLWLGFGLFLALVLMALVKVGIEFAARG
jgi:hypothetical protein